MSKMKLTAATLTMMAFAAVPAYAQVSSDDTEIDLDAEGNNVAVQNSGGNACFQKNENNQNARFNSGDVVQNNRQVNNCSIKTGDNITNIGDIIQKAEKAGGSKAKAVAVAAASSSNGGKGDGSGAPGSAAAGGKGDSNGGGQLPATGGASLLTLGAGTLLVAGGLVVRRIVK